MKPNWNNDFFAKQRVRAYIPVLIVNPEPVIIQHLNPPFEIAWERMLLEKRREEYIKRTMLCRRSPTAEASPLRGD